MKANQVGQPQSKVKHECETIPPKACAVCGKVSPPYGYVGSGRGQVCSRKCDNEYKEKENGRKHGA